MIVGSMQITILRTEQTQLSRSLEKERQRADVTVRRQRRTTVQAESPQQKTRGADRSAQIKSAMGGLSSG